MKRTPPRRNPHPNNPYSTFAPRSKPMPRVSQKTQATRNETDRLRASCVQAANKVDGCERCRCRPATDCHEIPAGSHRHVAVELPNVWLALCRECHGIVQGVAFIEQYNLKCEAVRHAINHCLGRAEL